MEELLALLTDGRSRTIEMIANELNTSVEDVKRKILFLEHSNIIRKVATSFPKTANKKASCSGHCTSCAGRSNCPACMPEGGFKNMGSMWEVIQ